MGNGTNGFDILGNRVVLRLRECANIMPTYFAITEESGVNFEMRPHFNQITLDGMHGFLFKEFRFSASSCHHKCTDCRIENNKGVCYNCASGYFLV